MNFKSDKDIKRLRSIESYLSHNSLSPHMREIIIKKFRSILIHPVGMDTDPIDSYRIIGRQIIRIELNKIIMDQVSRYHSIREWVRELYELWKLSHEMLYNAKSMARSLIYHGHIDGFYRESELDAIKKVPISKL